jgi:hypothetical protein
MKKGAHCQGTVLSKHNYAVPYAQVSVETYKHSGSKLRSRVSDTTDINGYFDLIYSYRKGDVVKVSIESDSGKLYEDLHQGNQEFHLK